MSPRSSKKRKLPMRKEGHDAPPTLASRVGVIEAYLRTENSRPATAVEHLQNLDTLSASVRGATLGGGIAKPPATIKPRLEGLIDRLNLLCVRLDQLDHTIAGNGGGNTEVSGAPAPFTIPDQLEVLETLITRALDRESAISGRF